MDRRETERAMNPTNQRDGEGERLSEISRARAREKKRAEGEEKRANVSFENCMKYVKTDFCEFFGLLSSGGLCKTFK